MSNILSTCNSINFQLPDDKWHTVARPAKSYRRLWTNAAGDRLSLAQLPPFDEQLKNVFSKPTQIPRYYRDRFSRAKRGLIECKLCRIGQHRAIYVIGKQAYVDHFHENLPDQNHHHGLTYLGLITIPLPDESYLFSLACSENGITGIREAVVSEKLLGHGLELSPRMWFNDPFDPAACQPYHRSLSDGEQYDRYFPDHPLAKLRRYMDDLIQSTSISASEREQGRSARILAQFRCI